MNNQAQLYIRRRLDFVAGIVGLVFLIIMIRAVDLHWLQADALKEKADRQHLSHYKVLAPRGAIVDQNGHILAESIQVPSIAAIAEDVPTKHIPDIAAILNVSESTLRKRLHQRRGFVWLARHVSPQQAEAIQALNLPGIREESEWQRFYPRGPETGHLLGFVGVDGKGLEGLERQFDSILTGKEGIREARRDAARHFLPGSSWLQAPQMGEKVQLTIDSSIQSMAYAALADAVRSNDAKGGSVIVMRPHDGAILAMASWPGYNPNNFRQFKPDQWRNRAVTDVFEPGSTLKPFTIAAALESKRWNPTSIIDCENGSFRIANHTIHDDHPEGKIDLTRVLVRSSNIGAAKLAMDIGPEALYAALDKSGLMQRTGIGLVGESSGIVPDIDRWGPVETSNIAFGQGIAVTALQLASAFTVFANQGMYIPPHIIQRQTRNERAERVFSKQTARQMLHILEAATLADGTGSNAVPAGYRLAGKTGTAQKAARGGYAKNKHTATFVGFIPVDEPQLVILAVIDEPQKSIYGGQVAAPIVRNIAGSALPYLGITPSYADTTPQTLRKNVASAASLHNETPATPQNFLHLSLREANVLAREKQLELLAHGSGWVRKQSPTSIANLQSGEHVEVWLYE